MKTTDIKVFLNNALYPVAYIGDYQAPSYDVEGVNNVVVGKINLADVDSGLDQIDSQYCSVYLTLYCNDKIKCDGEDIPISQIDQERYLDGCYKSLWDIGLNPSIIDQSKTPSTQTTLILEFKINIQGDK